MTRAGVAIAAVVVPVASIGLIELMGTILSAAVDRPYAIHFAGAALLMQIAFGVVAGTFLALLTARREDEAVLRDAAAIAVGLATGLGALHVLANGAAPVLDGASNLRLGIALAAGLAALSGFLRRLVPFCPGVASIALESPLLVAGGLGAYVALNLSTGQPFSKRALTLWLLASAGSFAVSVLLVRRSLRWSKRGRVLSLVAVPLLALAAGLGGVAFGRPVFPAVPARVGAPPDVLVVVLDTTRADFAPATPGAPVRTPNLSRLAEEGTRFTRAFSTSCWTLPAHGSLFTGLAPSEHGATWSSQHLPDEVTTLAERFRTAGRRTAAFSANPWITPEFGFDQGFERFLVGDPEHQPMKIGLVHFLPESFSLLGAATLYEDAGGLVLASEALRFLGSGEQPAFVFLNLLEPHLPYAPPNRFLAGIRHAGWDRRSLDAIDQGRLRDLRPGGEPSDREIEGLRRLYGGEVAYVDWLVGRILFRLEEAGRLDDTVVVVTSDHGENLGQHPPLDHQLGLFDSLVHVPLLIRYPAQVPAGVTREDLVSLVDVSPALMHLANEEWQGPPGPLLGGPGRRAVFFEYDRPAHILELIRERLGVDPSPWDRTLRGIRTSDWKWIEASDGRHEAYDLRTDPGEMRNLVVEPGTVPQALSPLPELLEAVQARQAPRAGSDSAPPISEETADRLRSLGYLP